MADYYTQDFTDLRLDGVAPREVDKCIPRFFLQDRLRGDQITQIEMVEVITPGDRLSRPILRVGDEHRRRWPRQYEAFKAGVTPSVNGTPIATWGEIDWSIRDEFRAAGFQTIEQLAQADDGHLGSLNNGTLWRRKAQLYVEKNVTSAAKDQQIVELSARLAALEAKNVSDAPRASDVVPKRKGGRPRKASVPEGQPGASVGVGSVSAGAS